MVRKGLFALLGATLLFGAGLPVVSAPGEDSESKLRSQLAVQLALQQGRDNLQRGNYQAAVYVLEGQIARVDGNREYMTALREAYRGYIRELLQSKRPQEAQVYQERLTIIDPGYHLELNAGRSRTPTVATLASQPPSPAPAPAPGPRTPETPARPTPPLSPPKLGGDKGGAPTPGPAFTARPQIPDDDPFADSNSSRHHAHTLLDRAEQEFSRGQYESAGRLYEQAHRLDSKADDAARERWAYCKLFGVVETLNRSAGAAPPPELERQVQMALALSSTPKLEGFGKDLLRKIQERRSPTAPAADAVRIEVRHTPAQGQNWAIAETTNFRVRHHQSRELAEKVARIAETTRSAMGRKWFGEDPPRWEPPCEVYLHANAQDYARATAAPLQSPGHSTIHRERDGGRVVIRRIDLRCDEPHLLDGVLPHEATHVVLAGRFGRHDVPRWVDEGIAVLTEPRERINLHLRNLPRHRDDRQLFGIGQLMNMKDYPDGRLIGPFYAQSVSLVDFLSSQPGGPQTFIRFVREGLDGGGYEAALRRHYHFQGFADLEQRWQAHAFPSGSTSAKLSLPAR